jgi:hypothetical protein
MRKHSLTVGIVLALIPIPLMFCFNKFSRSTDLKELGYVLTSAIVISLLAAIFALVGEGRGKGLCIGFSLAEAVFLFFCGLGW